MIKVKSKYRSIIFSRPDAAQKWEILNCLASKGGNRYLAINLRLYLCCVPEPWLPPPICKLVIDNDKGLLWHSVATSLLPIWTNSRSVLVMMTFQWGVYFRLLVFQMLSL